MFCKIDRCNKNTEMATTLEILCNRSTFAVFDRNQIFPFNNSSVTATIFCLDQCFQQTVLVAPIYLTFLIYCSFRLGRFAGGSAASISSQSPSLISGSLVALLAAQIILSVATESILAFKLTLLLKIVCIVVYFLLLSNSHSIIHSHFKLGLPPIILVNLSECITIYLSTSDHISLAFSVFSFTLWIVHCYALFSYHPVPLIRLSVDQDNDDDEITLADDETHFWLSQLCFTWVSPLLNKGRDSGINGCRDLFRLPGSLQVNRFIQTAKGYLDSGNRKQSLVRCLFSVISFRLLFLSIIKFFADASSMLLPVLLNRLLLYLDEDNCTECSPRSRQGFLFALLLLFCTVVNAVFISFFNFQMNKISLQIRTVLISLLYEKLFRLRSTVMMDRFGTGQILNLAHTDIERVINLVPSVFQFISLPVQLLITLYLLYNQVGFVFLAGVIFILALIPVNKLICNKITHFSAKMMHWKDARIKMMTEILKGIRTIKMHAWEDLFREKVMQSRRPEVRYLRYRKYLDALCVYFWATTPVILSSLVFGTFVYVNGAQNLTSSMVFTTLALLAMLIMPLNALPWVLNGLMEALVSLKRLTEFYSLPEIDLLNDFIPLSPQSDAIFQLDNCSFTYVIRENSNFTLRNLNMAIVASQFIGVTGRVGSGKTSLIKAFLNELHRIQGDFYINSNHLDAIGYVPQEPWILNTTVRENILFGNDYDPERYAKVLDACELAQDIQLFPRSDQTPIGNHGATLSGGQKSRIALARALYQDFNVYLIDEPFASVDRHVAAQIYRKCFQGLLKNKTVVLVTNHTEYLREAAVIWHLENGMVSEKHSSLDGLNVEDEKNSDKNPPNTIADDDLLPKDEEQEEERAYGTIESVVYGSYMAAIGYWLFALIIILVCLMQITRSGSDLWLSLWTRNNHDGGSPSSRQTLKYLYIFITIGVINSFVTLLRAAVFAYGGVRAATNVHDRLLNSLFRCSLLFFDLISFGIIINRFSSDTFNVDDALPFTLNILLAQISSLLISLIITIYGMPWIIAIFLLIIIPYYWIQQHFRITSRELKRIAATALSPIYSQLDDTIQGLAVIRSAGHTQRFRRRFYDAVTVYNRIQYAIGAVQQWLNLRLQLIGAVVTSSVAFIAVYLHYYRAEWSSSASLVGLSLVYSLSLTNLLNGSVQAFTQTELDLISVERIIQLVKKLASHYEDADDDENSITTATNVSVVGDGWPNQGVVSFKNVSMRYRQENDFALRNVSFETKPGEHVAIVGRTGSGKSSIFQTLLRLVPIHSGVIMIDDVDVQTIDRRVLRSRIGIIPQEAFLFHGTIRQNVDPLNRHRDEEIWTALFDCKINMLVDSLGGLDCPLRESGTDLSIGQRHLFCLARAVLNGHRILCLDELTANIDAETAAVLDELMTTVFRETTVLHIAHKIETIRYGYDRVIMMDDGSVAGTVPLEDYLRSQVATVPTSGR